MTTATKTQPKVDWGIYAITPRIVRTQYNHLSHAEKWLYTCLKDLCGDHGVCFRSMRSLSAETGICIGSLSTMIPHLHESGLIHAEKKKRSLSGKEIWHISIVDIWQLNAKYCSKDCSKNEHESNEIVQKMNEVSKDCSKNERDCSNFQYRRITLKNTNTTEEEGTYDDAATADIDEHALFLLLAKKLGLEDEKVNQLFQTSKDEEIVAPDTQPLEVPQPRTPKKAATPKTVVEKVVKPVQQTLKIELSSKEQEFWNLWCSLWFNADIAPNLSETAYKHIARLAPHIDTTEKIVSLSAFSRKELEAKGIKNKIIHLGNMVNSYPGWKQTQAQETSSTDNSQPEEEEEEINIHEKKELIRFIEDHPDFLVKHRVEMMAMPKYAFLFNNSAATIPVGV